MKRFIIRFSMIGVISLSLIVFVLGASAAQQRLVLDDPQESYQLEPFFSVLVDENAELSFDQIIEGDYIPASEVDFSSGDNAYWLRLDVINQGPVSTEWLVVYHQNRINQISAFLPEADGPGYREVHTGNTYAFSSRDFDYREFVFKLKAPVGEPVAVFFRLQDIGGVSPGSFEVQSLEVFTQSALKDQFWSGAYYFTIATILVYNVFFIFSIRDKATISFILFLLSVMFISLSDDGIGHQFIWRESVLISEYSALLSTLLFVGALLNFTLVELETKRHYPRWNRAARIFLWSMAAFFLIRLLEIIPMQTLNAVFGLFLILLLLMPIALALRTLKIKRRQALTFLLAFAGYLLVVLFLALNAVFFPENVIPGHYFTRSSLIWLLFVFTITANERINALRLERERSQTLLLEEQAEALQLQTMLNEEISRAREELEERVRERTRELRESNRELESFSYSVSHDLRAPLRAIQGFSEILKEDYQQELKPEVNTYLDRIIAATARMNDLIEDLLDLSRVSRVALEKTEVDLSALASEVLAELRGVKPETEITATISPGLVAECDPGMIRIVLKNLLENAVKFSLPKNAVEITVGRAMKEGCTAFFVQDHGIGFNPEQANQIFDVFQRYHTDIPGTGIGLAIVKRIILKHNGRVWADSVPGEGSTFYFYV